MRYLVSYDRNTPGVDRQPLREALASLGAQRILKCQWVLEHNGTTCRGLANHLLPFVDPEDRLLVTELDGGGRASYNLMVDLNAVWCRATG